MNQLVNGLVPILATPFDNGGALDVPSLTRLTEFCLQSGVNGVAVFGMASEGFALTTQERHRILTAVLDVVAGSVPVVAGVNATSTATAIEQSEAAVTDGADALMVLPPFLTKPGPDQLVEFYGEVATAAGAEVMVQDNPGASGVAMPTELIAALSELPNVTSVKIEAPPTAPKVGAIRAAVPNASFAVLGGQNAQFCLDEHERGATGTMPACEFADLLATILATWNAGDRAQARDDIRRLLPLIIAGLQPGIAWAIHKEVLLARGLITAATVRSPARPIDGLTRKFVRETITPFGWVDRTD